MQRAPTTSDAGSKAVSFDGPLPSVQSPQGLGERVLLGLPHCDPTINFHDAFTVVRAGAVVGTGR